MTTHCDKTDPKALWEEKKMAVDIFGDVFLALFPRRLNTPKNLESAEGKRFHKDLLLRSAVLLAANEALNIVEVEET